MKKLTLFILIACAVLSACQEKEQQSPVQPPPAVKQYQPEITARACVNGLSMIRVRFSNGSILVNHADLTTWVYEMKQHNRYTNPLYIHC